MRESARRIPLEHEAPAVHQDNPLKIAEAAAKMMWSRDRASQALGMALLEVRPGYARMQMAIRENMANVHRTGHGGFTFTLADSTFAYACNSHNRPAVAVTCNIDFIRPVHVGDVLVATGVEQSLAGRNGVYDIRVENQNGELVALFRGKSQQIKGSVTDEPPKPG